MLKKKYISMSWTVASISFIEFLIVPQKYKSFSHSLEDPPSKQKLKLQSYGK